MAPKRRKYPTVSPYARVTSTRRNQQKRGLVVVDGNSPEAHFLRRVQKQLVEHLGGNPTVAERALVNRIAWIELRCLMLDQKALSGNETAYDDHVYLAHANSLKRLYGALGLQSPKKSFAELMRRPGRPRKGEA